MYRLLGFELRAPKAYYWGSLFSMLLPSGFKASQTFRNPLTKEYALDHIRDPAMI